MVSFKNIRIKMKSGKSRPQRVKVLASGKYKFVKNIKSSKSSKSKKSTPKRKRNPSKRGKGGRRMGNKSITRTAFKWLRVGSLVAPAAAMILDPSRANKEKVERIIEMYSGYNPYDRTWKWESLMQGWAPYIGTCLMTYGVPKLVSIIRRL